MPHTTILQSTRTFDNTSNGQAHLDLASNRVGYGQLILLLWRRVIRIGDFTALAALTQELDLQADLTALSLGRLGQSPDFPPDVDILRGPYLRTITDFSGGGASAVSVVFGDTADPNELLTTTSVFSGAPRIVRTPAAAAFDIHREGADTDLFVPTLTITSDVNIDTLTDGELEVLIPFMVGPRDTTPA